MGTRITKTYLTINLDKGYCFFEIWNNRMNHWTGERTTLTKAEHEMQTKLASFPESTKSSQAPFELIVR